MLHFYNNKNIDVLLLLLLCLCCVCMWRRRHAPVLLAVTVRLVLCCVVLIAVKCLTLCLFVCISYLEPLYTSFVFFKRWKQTRNSDCISSGWKLIWAWVPLNMSHSLLQIITQNLTVIKKTTYLNPFLRNQWPNIFRTCMLKFKDTSTLFEKNKVIFRHVLPCNWSLGQWKHRKEPHWTVTVVIAW